MTHVPQEDIPGSMEVTVNGEQAPGTLEGPQVLEV